MGTVSVEDETHEQLKQIKENSPHKTLNAVILQLVETHDTVDSLQQQVDNLKTRINYLEPTSKNYDQEITADIYQRLNLTHSLLVPPRVGQYIYGKPLTQGNKPRLARFFLEGNWLLNESFADDPEYFDIVMMGEGALLAYNGSLVDSASKTIYFFIPREHYNKELRQIFETPETEILLPPGGYDITWREYNHDIPIPMRHVEYSGADYWPILGYGLDDNEITQDTMSSFTHLQTVGEALNITATDTDDVDDGLTVQSADGINVHIDDPIKTYRRFVQWCLSRANWDLREGVESSDDAQNILTGNRDELLNLTDYYDKLSQ